MNSTEYTEKSANRRNNNILGIVAVIILSAINLLHFPLFFLALAEQVQTGWGYGTNLELGVLFWWLAEIVLSVPFILACVFTALSFIQRDLKGKVVANTSLICMFVLQIVFSNLFFIF